jgi:sporadic carbohydrate cluster 2OG-Fe(II) oxygenase
MTNDELRLSEQFLEKGYVVVDVDDRQALDRIRHEVVKLTCEHLKRDLPNDEGYFLDHIHELVEPKDLNALRYGSLFLKLNDLDWFRPAYFACARKTLETLVGNELAMQNKVNLSVQMSNDDSSILPIHADVFGGETPFQVVEWLPLVDCFGTKSMFLLPRKENDEILPQMHTLGNGGMSELYNRVEKDLIWCDVPYGKVMVFTTNQLHGNIVNTEPTTRWSMNCRFTGLFTPYTSPEKKLGSFYLPITTRAVTKVGIAYAEPSGFAE